MDARSLLRAKKAEARIEHPYASYSARGDLRCSVCAVPVKQWEAHLLTKQHRTSVAREKAEEAARLAKAAKRAAPTSSTADGAAGGEHDDNGEPEAKRARTGAGALPEGFFSKGNERSFSDDEDEQEAGDAAGKPTPAAEIPAKTGDAELDNFFASLAAPEEAAAPIQTEYSIKQATTGVKGKRAAYKEVIPGQASYEAAPVRNVAAAEEEKEPTPEPEETPAQRKERLAREEREEIMARLEEEERAQEDADSRVSMLKQRMEALKRKRAARAAGAGSKGKGNGGGGSNDDGDA